MLKQFALLTALILGATIGAAACQDDTETPQSEGSIGLRIIVGAHEIDSLDYAISRPGEPDITGTVDVSGPADERHRIGAIPVGTGYTIRLEGESTDMLLLNCVGDSAPFDVAADVTTAVDVTISCTEVTDTGTTTDTSSDTSSSDSTSDTASSGEGAVDVEVGVNIRPTVSSIVADPESAPIGSNIIVTASGADADGDSLTYAWSSDGDPLPDESAVAYACAVAGDHGLTVTVSDGKGSVSQSIVVHCTE